ncbi:MAG: IclR family transcriptional regulator [Pseudomonadota bacterium]
MHTDDAPTTGRDEKPLVNTVSHAVLMLEAFGAQPVQGLNELSRTVGIPRASALRILRTLMAHGIVGRADTKYRLTRRLMELGASAGSPQAMQMAVAEVLQALVAQTGETSHFAQIEGARVVYLAKHDSPHPIRMNSYVGWHGPVYATAVGKALLALRPAQEVHSLLPAKLERFTPGTIVSRARLLDELALVAERGFAVDDEELVEGLRCVAVAVPGAGGAVSVAGPASRMDDARLVEIVALIRATLEDWRP